MAWPNPYTKQHDLPLGDGVAARHTPLEIVAHPAPHDMSKSLPAM